MNIDQTIGQVRPITTLVGTVLIIAGLCKFFGVQIPISGSGLEIAVAGWLMKGI